MENDFSRYGLQNYEPQIITGDLDHHTYSKCLNVFKEQEMTTNKTNQTNDFSKMVFQG